MKKADPLAKIIIPLAKPFKNGEYLWQDDNNIGFWVNHINDRPVFLSKSLINGEVEMLEKGISFWIERSVAKRKNIDRFEDTSHMPSLF